MPSAASSLASQASAPLRELAVNPRAAGRIHIALLSNSSTMNRMKICTLAVAAMTLMLGGCAATAVKETWKSPAYQGGPVQKIAVLAVDDREQYRSAVECHFNAQLNDQGQKAFVTYDLLSLPEIKADKEAAAASLRKSGADTLLLVRLQSQANHDSEVRATPAYFAPTISGYGNADWFGFYSVAFTDMGTVWGNSTREVYLETSLFDLKTEKRLWSSNSRTLLKEETDRVAELAKLVGKLLAGMRKDGLIH